MFPGDRVQLDVKRGDETFKIKATIVALEDEEGVGFEFDTPSPIAIGDNITVMGMKPIDEDSNRTDQAG